MKKSLTGSFNLLKCTGYKLHTHVWKIWCKLSQILAMCCMVLIKKPKKKLPPSVVPIHPHHTINAEGCHISSFKRRNCKKTLTLIRTNAQQEKTQTKAKVNLGGTLCGGITEKGR